MFKSQKIEPPKTLSMQEIQEDLETFVKTERIINKVQIIDDFKARQDEEINSNEWWDAWEVTKLQIEQLKEKYQQIADMKNDLKSHRDQIEQSQLVLLDEIEDNLKNIQQSKSPN